MRNTTQNLFPLIFNIMGALKGNFSLFFWKKILFFGGSNEKKTIEENRYSELTEGRERKGRNLS